MSSEVYDLTLPAHDPNASRPRGLLPVLPKVAEAVAREQARMQPYFTDVKTAYSASTYFEVLARTTITHRRDQAESRRWRVLFQQSPVQGAHA